MKFEIEGHVVTHIVFDINADSFDEAQEKARKHVKSLLEIIPEVEKVSDMNLYAFQLPEDD